MNIIISSNSKQEGLFELVERKGFGHPDTLADRLAERLSARYSVYTLDRFGVVLHHNFDKLGLLGGASSVDFGSGTMTSPIRVLLNGRASFCYGKNEINVLKLLKGWTKDFFREALPQIDVNKDLEFHDLLSTQSSPGKMNQKDNIERSARSYWFSPRGIQDIPEIKHLVANDTSLGG